MLYLEQRRNRVILMVISSVTSATVAALLIQGINAVGVLMATLIINVLVYYALPGRYSKAYMEKYLDYLNTMEAARGVVKSSQHSVCDA